MSLKFPIWISGSIARDHRLVGFSSAARAYAYLSAHRAGCVEIELASELRFRLMLASLQGQGIVELSLDPEPDGSAAMSIPLSMIWPAL